MTDEQRADQENAAGMAHVRAGRIADAIPHFAKASEHSPNDTLLRNNWSAALVETGRFAEALTVLDTVVAREPAYAEAHHHRGVALRGLGRPRESAAATAIALRVRPDYPDALVSLAMTQIELGDMEGASQACAQALSLQPRLARAMLVMGMIAARRDEVDQALDWFSRVIALQPQNSEAYRHAGIILAGRNRTDEAIACFEQAVAGAGADAETCLRLADLQAAKGLMNAAIATYDRALALDPDLAFARVQRLHLLSWQCRWEEIARDVPLVSSLGVTTGAVSPFAMLAFEDAPERHRLRSERYAERFFSTVAAPKRAPIKPVATGRIRLGYFSSDFQNHATAYLAARLFELHDRDHFEVHAFSFGPPSDDPMRARLIDAFEGFHDVSGFSDAAVADLASETGLDIAIDLKGYTAGQRLGILARRPAPVQISFLGYPGSTGAPFIDYLVSDPHVIPAAERAHYSERLIVLPHCYQPTDDQRLIGPRPSRFDAGLPDNGFIFAAFNHSWKIGREEFDCWAGLLNAVDGSYLWLLASGNDAEINLKREIERRGVAPDRLIFAPFLPQDQHIARLQLADLLLDTFRYGAHTTASDALWAGVPVVTCRGRGFATRVATSLVRNIGLDEMATGDRAAYASLALDLAQNPDRLAAVRSRLQGNRATTPLFDSLSFTRAIERGFTEAHRRWDVGEAPVDICLSA